jgi:hypothetical protein
LDLLDFEGRAACLLADGLRQADEPNNARQKPGYARSIHLLVLLSI